MYRLMGHERDDDNYLEAIQSMEHWKSSAGRKWSPIATEESRLVERRRYRADVAQIRREEVRAKVSVVTPGNCKGNFVQPARGDGKQNKPVVSSYGC